MAASDVLAKIKLRMGLPDGLDTLVNSYIDEIGNRIKHFCNVSEIPTDLEGVWASMTMDALRVELPSVDAIAETVDTGESTKIGDTSVSGGGGKAVSNMTKSVIDDVVLNYKIDLKHHRKLRR